MSPTEPMLIVLYVGGMADVVASDGGAYKRGERCDSVNVPRTELSNGLTRILTGISSKMFEKVRRWLIRLWFLSVHPPRLRSAGRLPCRTEVMSSVCLNEGFCQTESAERRVPLRCGCRIWVLSQPIIALARMRIESFIP